MAQIEQADEEYKTDMTPMIDVVFLLIVFFICIDFKVLEAKLDAWLPTDKGSSREVTPPVEQLSVKVVVDNQGTKVFPEGGSNAQDDRPARYRLEGHTVRYEVGARLCRDLDHARRELKRIAEDPSLMIPDPDTGGRKVMACVVEGYPGTCYDDVARAADVCRNAGFDEIQFGGGMGQLR